jgi:hypothetical protein
VKTCEVVVEGNLSDITDDCGDSDQRSDNMRPLLCNMYKNKITYKTWINYEKVCLG